MEAKISKRKKTTRTRRSSDNPLASARKHDKVESLWHRKSGAAFRLFLEYYASQPMGVCSDGKSAITCSKLPSRVKMNKDQEEKPARTGQSRAAKRRKKRKNQNHQVHGSTETLTCVNTEANEKSPQSPTAIHQDCEYSNDRLIRAFLEFDSPSDRAQIQNLVCSLAKPLPLTFRIRKTVAKEQEGEIRDILDKDFGQIVHAVSFDFWIYQAKSSSLNKGNLFKVAPKLKEFLVRNALNGTIARQELASMLPVLALSRGGWLRQGVRVLDMCASPGSKTLQALEIVGATGRVKANDVNEKRIESLKDAVQRSGLDTIHRVKYTNVDASKFPIPSDTKRLYDTILCDVPCSGDGTIRKDPHILSNWTPATSNALHSLQVRILLRALQCLKVGAVMSYSTCSLNPVENEAVVAAAIAQFRALCRDDDKDNEPSVELVPWPDTIDGLVGHAGVADWKIADYVGDTDEDDEDMVRLRWHASHEEAVAANMEHALPSMWPPPNVESLHLNRCFRLWPQDQDSGGFFVALIRRNQ